MTPPFLLDRSQFSALADALGESPQTTIAVHLLRRGLCSAYAWEAAPSFGEVIVQDRFSPAEPTAFGSNAERLWGLLQSVEGWDCVNVESRCATALGAIVEREMQCRVRYYGDVHHVLTVPARTFSHQAVRRLTVDDLELLARAPHQVRGAGFHSSRELLEQGIVACAVISGEVVSIAHTYARTRHYADIGVHTLEEWRGRGFAAAAASLVARLIQQAGQIPVWSAGEDNQASLGLAKKLGFTEISRRTYVIPDPRT